eukprot:688961-Karenia_brevis.AAC.1
MLRRFAPEPAFSEMQTQIKALEHALELERCKPQVDSLTVQVQTDDTTEFARCKPQVDSLTVQ